MYFTSTYRHGVDEKRRVQVPSKWRPEEEGVELTLLLWSAQGAQSAHLRVLPPGEMQALMDKIKAMPSGDQEAVALRRNIAKNSDTVTVDKGGRICIPEAMAKAVGVEKDAVLAGALQWFEIWNPERYAAASTVDDALSPEALKKI